MKFINKIILSIAITAATTACFDDSQSPVNNSQPNQAPQAPVDNNQTNQSPVNNSQPNQIPQNSPSNPQSNQTPQASITNVQYTQTQTNFNPVGRWRCVSAAGNPDYFVLVDSSIINAYPNGRFESQVIRETSSETIRLIAQGNWNFNQREGGLYFIPDNSNSPGYTGALVAGGNITNQNSLNSNKNTCQRIG